jgi:PAS domain S-box-containing protein
MKRSGASAESEGTGSSPAFPRGTASSILPREDFSERRRAFYLVQASALFVAAVLVFGLERGGSPLLHSLLATVATVLAVAVGSTALVGFYSRRRTTQLFIGTAFLGTAVLDGYHTLATAAFLTPVPADDATNLSAWTWLAARLFLALVLCASWVAWYREEQARLRRREVAPLRGTVLYPAAAALVLLFLVLVHWPLGEAYRGDMAMSRVGELLPGFFFLLALIGVVRKADWGRDASDHSLVVALVFLTASHLLFTPFAAGPLDASMLAGRILTVLAYGCVFAGLMASVYVTFRWEEEVSATIRKANEALAREVKIRREVERTIQEEEQRLQDFLDNANDLIQSTDPDGRILYVNQAWKRTLGYGDHEVGPMNILEVIHPESREAFKEAMARVFQGEAVSDFEITFQAKDGEKVICSGSSNCRFEGGRPVATRSILRNLTEEIRAGRELARSQANIRALFESTGDAIWSVDRACRLITFNTTYALTVEAITGRAPRVGDALGEVVGTGEAEWFRGCYARAFSGIRFSAIREESLDGDTRTFELYFNPIEGEGDASGVVVFSKDISRRRRVEEALRRAKQESEEANRAKSQFMANMSHELRTPLNSVIGFANILLKDQHSRLGDKEKGFLERVLANGRHLLGLINEILDLSKIEAGRMELKPESVELQELIRVTLAQLEGQLGAKPVKLRSEWEGEPGAIHADSGKLKQVLINLVGNALKFTESGEVVVRIETEADGRTPARIMVRDTGVGIPEDRLEAIFEAFQQADAGTTRKFGGTGLGLTISRSLCTLMGYDLTAESTVGEGSVFTIDLGRPPAIPDESAMEGVQGELDAPWTPLGLEEAGRLKGRKVLVVDDEVDARAILSHYLEGLSCRVVTASDGVEGLEVARKERPDLITLDLMMPRMDGWQMLRALKDDPELREIPVVVVSMATREGAGHFLGAVDLLDKPVDREALIRVLGRTITREIGRVLVVDDNPDTRLILRRYLKEAGLEVHTVKGGEEALSFLQRRDVDLVLLDLMMPGLDGFTTLRRIRALPTGNALPVVVLTAKQLTVAERRRLHEQANRVIHKGGNAESRLRGVLEAHFDLEGKED